MNREKKKTRPYTEGVERRTVPIDCWVCTTCGFAYQIVNEGAVAGAVAGSSRYDEIAKEAAQACCAESFPCYMCGAPSSRRHDTCQACRLKHKAESFAKLEVRAWKGEPICEQYGDRYFFDADAVNICEHYETLDRLKQAQLVFAEPQRVPKFDAEDLLEDYLPDDDDTDLSSLDAPMQALNDAIKALEPLSWLPGGVAVDVEALWREAEGRHEGGAP